VSNRGKCEVRHACRLRTPLTPRLAGLIRPIISAKEYRTLAARLWHTHHTASNWPIDAARVTPACFAALQRDPVAAILDSLSASVDERLSSCRGYRVKASQYRGTATLSSRVPMLWVLSASQACSTVRMAASPGDVVVRADNGPVAGCMGALQSLF